ncbi:hypothetical protein E2542_SST31059 [Spatholobus suberectus]|nr:hypothetical protein E2542_SST31059 [Spatholobus suberectus]
MPTPHRQDSPPHRPNRRATNKNSASPQKPKSKPNRTIGAKPLSRNLCCRTNHVLSTNLYVAQYPMPSTNLRVSQTYAANETPRLPNHQAGDPRQPLLRFAVAR